MSNDHHVVVAGVTNVETSVSVDGFPLEYVPARYPRRGINTRVAGVGYNVAAGLRALGVPVSFATYVGDDSAGAVARARLEHLDLSGATSLKAPSTAQSVVLVDPSGRRSVHTDSKDLPDAVYPQEVFEKAMAGADLAVLTNIGFSRPLLGVARGKGVPIACDIHAIADLEDAYNQDFMAAATVLFCSHERLPTLPEVWARQVLARYDSELVVIGLGDQGCLVAERRGALTRVPAAAVGSVVNTAGGGDALCAAFLDGWRRGQDPVHAARRAMIFAAAKIAAAPGTDGFLNRAELDERFSATSRAAPPAS